MLELKKVAVTGNLFSGKSTVCKFLKDIGAFVLSADQIVDDLLKNPQVIQSLADIFGKSCIDPHGLVDKVKLAQKVFDHPGRLLQLEGLLHPLVLEEIQKKYREESRSSTSPLFVVEVPLLFEVRWDYFFDHCVLVIADPKVRMNRYKNEGKSTEDFLHRQARQISSQEAIDFADTVIENSTSLSDLKEKVTTLFRTLTN